MRIGIFDKDSESAALLARESERFARRTDIPGQTIVTVFSDCAELLDAILQHGLELLFLSTHLTGDYDRGDGLELARRIRIRDPLCRVVFVSRTTGFAPRSYDVGAFYYLLKPLRSEKLMHVLQLALQPEWQRSPPGLTLKTVTGLIRFSKNDLLYIESIDHQQVFHFRDGKPTVKTASRLIDLYSLFADDPQFIMPHRAYIVNLAQIRSLSGHNFILINGTCVPISKNNYTRAKEAYLRLFPVTKPQETVMSR